MHCPKASGVTDADGRPDDDMGACIVDCAACVGESVDLPEEHAAAEPITASAARPENAVRTMVCLITALCLMR